MYDSYVKQFICEYYKPNLNILQWNDIHLQSFKDEKSCENVTHVTLESPNTLSCGVTN